jgi:hypothetical protein
MWESIIADRQSAILHMQCFNNSENAWKANCSVAILAQACYSYSSSYYKFEMPPRANRVCPLFLRLLDTEGIDVAMRRARGGGMAERCGEWLAQLCTADRQRWLDTIVGNMAVHHPVLMVAIFEQLNRFQFMRSYEANHSVEYNTALAVDESGCVHGDEL